MKTITSLLALVLMTFQSYTAYACTYDINKEQKSEELKEVALADLVGENIISAQVVKFSYYESKPTPMCPEEMTYEATINVYFKSGMTKCYADVKVTKVESWKDDFSSYTVTGKKHAHCNR